MFRHWDKGVVGIVASRLLKLTTVQRLYCVMMEIYYSSVRSVKGFDVHEILVEIEDIFVRFGGHKTPLE